MRPLRALVIYIIAVFLGGALLAPWLYQLAQAVPGLAKNEFYFYVQNSLLIVALAGAWPLLRALGATGLRDFGWVSPAGEWKKVLGGFALSFLSLLLVAIPVVALGVRRIDADMHFVHASRKILGALFTGLGVAVLEETLFRGAIFGVLRKVFDWRFALVLSSAVYALVHFFAPVEFNGAVNWLSGIQLLPKMLAGFVDVHELLPQFFNLMLVGSVLALAYQRTGNLYFSVGAHAGWIFFVKAFMTCTDDGPVGTNWFFGTGKMVNGWLAFLVLAATLWVFTRLPVGRKQNDVAR